MPSSISTMNIGQAAKASGVHAKMIRHYESIGLITKAKRTDSGYRVYDANDIYSLRFIRRARDLGFSIKEIKYLLNLWRNKKRASSQVKALALSHIQELEAKIEELQDMRDTLLNLANHCQGDERPDCPILSQLGNTSK